MRLPHPSVSTIETCDRATGSRPRMARSCEVHLRFREARVACRVVGIDAPAWTLLARGGARAACRWVAGGSRLGRPHPRGCGGPATRRRSRIVRAGVVVGMPWRIVAAFGSEARRAVYPDALAPLASSNSRGRSHRRRPPSASGGPQSIAALRWLRHRAVSAREYSGHPSPLVSEVPVADRIHAAEDAVEPPCLETHLDCAAGKPSSEQLRDRDHTMLPSRNACSEGIRTRFGAFCTHTGS